MQESFMDYEKVGEHFSLDTQNEGQRLAWKALHHIATVSEPGMKETDIYHLGLRTFKEFGFSKFWHPLHVRVGINTTKPYGEKSEPDVVLQENDIFFIDAGGIFQGHETDVGRTFLMGDHPEYTRCRTDCESIYDEVQKHWQENKVTGRDLYEHAVKLTQSKGWTFCHEGARGHRISDFPHKLHFKGPMDDLTFSPMPHRWILEIQIKSPDNKFGAFKEDVLKS